MDALNVDAPNVDAPNVDALDRMPPEAPLAVAPQSWSRVPNVRALPPARGRGALSWRVGVLVASLALTAGTVATFADGLRPGGLHALELLLLGLLSLTFFWIAFSAAVSIAGTARLRRPHAARPAGERRQRVALLVPVHEEDPETVIGAAAAMAADLPPRHDWALFVLSDTRTEAVARRESIAAAAASGWSAVPIWWRRRTRNEARKAGNVMEWVSRWGGAWDGFVVLDADSLMTGGTLGALADALAAAPDAGLIQTQPRLVGGETLFSRLQQFATGTYGGPLAEGLAAFAGGEGNYWGHNAIIRTRAFAETAALPAMPRLAGGLAGGGLVLSHDFVEAGLMRRAGWRVRFEPRLPGSWEAAPASLAEHIARDRRWCHGNLQHLALLGARGFHPVSRFHMLAGAMAYLTAPLWLALLTIWALVGNGEGSMILYFTPENPLYPVWPEMNGVGGPASLAFFYGMLLLPKALGLACVPRALRRPRLALDAVAEIAASMALAPIMMVQQTLAVLRFAAGRPMGWAPATRGARRPGWAALARLHAPETTLGVVLTGAIAAGAVSPWLLPIALPLLVSVPISHLSSARAGAGALATAEMLDPPPLVAEAAARAEALRALSVAAE